MWVAESYVGNRETSDVDEPDTTVVLTDTERRRSRVRTETTDERELGITVGRELRDGDVVATENGDRILVELADVEALVVDLSAVDRPVAALRFGHAVGNRHWDLAVRDGEAVLPLADARERMTALVEEQLPGADHRYESVSPTLFDGDGHDHDHEHGDGHDHDHEHGATHGAGRSGADRPEGTDG
jgi:urease accessory protein